MVSEALRTIFRPAGASADIVSLGGLLAQAVSRKREEKADEQGKMTRHNKVLLFGGRSDQVVDFFCACLASKAAS